MRWSGGDSEWGGVVDSEWGGVVDSEWGGVWGQ